MKKQIVSQLLGGAVFVTLLAAITQNASASYTLSTAPDAGSTSLLMAIACAGLAAVRRFKR